MNFLSKTFLILFFFVFSYDALSQNEMDSLKYQLSISPEDTNKVRILLRLSWLSRRINPVYSIENAFEAVQLAEQHSMLSESLKGRSFIGIALRSANHFDDALVYFKNTLKLSIKENSEKEIGFSYINIGYTYLLKKEYKYSEKYLKEAIKIADSLGDFQLIDYSYSYLLNLYFEKEKFDEALLWSRKVENVKIERRENTRLAILYKTKGDIYMKLQQYAKSLTNYQKGLTVLNADSLSIYRIHSKLAILYLKQKKLNKSLESSLSAYNSISNHSSSGFTEIDFSYLKIELCTTLSEIYQKQKEFEKLAYYQNLILLEKDKIINNKTIQETLNADTRKRLKEKERENDKLIFEKQKRDQIAEIRNLIELGIAIIILFLGTFTFVLFRERKKLRVANELLVQQKEELKELNNTKDKFFSIVAHDLKNPFNALFGLLDILRENLKEENISEANTVLNYMLETVSASYNLLENLLNWSQSQREKIKYNPEEMLLIEIVDRVIRLQNSNAKEKSIQIKVQLSESDIVFADKNMIYTVFRNLISNAVKFSYENSSITILSSFENDKLKITINDTGVGIEDENLIKIFDVSESISTHGTAGETGTGIGLPLCKEFIEKNKGTIGVESELGKGSSFWFVLPTKPS